MLVFESHSSMSSSCIKAGNQSCTANGSVPYKGSIVQSVNNCKNSWCTSQTHGPGPEHLMVQHGVSKHAAIAFSGGGGLEHQLKLQ